MADAASLQARLDELRTHGAAERAPVQFAYLGGLARRAATQAEPIRRPLFAKLKTLADALSEQLAQPATTAEGDTPPPSPLADLLAYIGQHAHELPGASRPTNSSPPPAPTTSPARPRSAPELKSVTYFRNEWSKLSTEQQLTQTLAQAPENAGPMNSQHLVLRALQVMRDVSPDYLQGFMSYIDTLIWLEHADPTKPAPGRVSSGTTKAKARTTKRSAANR